MNDFLQLVFGLLQRGIGIAVIVVGLCCGLMVIVYFIHRAKTKGEKRFPWLKAVVILALVAYIVILLFVTLMRHGSTGYAGVNFHLFRSWREAWNNYSLKNWLNVLLNITMFVPLGCLLPLLHTCFKKWYVLFAIGGGTTLFIETVQYFTGRGLFDVDDVFTNILGTVIGYCVVMMLLYLFKKGNRKKCIPYFICPVVFSIVLIGIFVKYENQEYGNLREAPVITANTNGIEWNLECELSEESDIVPIYSTVPFNKKTCDAFGAEFAQIMDISFPDTYYYDNSTIFANHSTGDFLNVDYFDRSWEYSEAVGFMLGDAEVDEDTLRELLKPYPVSIPDTAVFSYDGNGLHTLTVEMEIDGNTVIDGTITCKVKEGNLLEKVNNHLGTYVLYKEETIISEMEAYAQMCSGKFYGSERLVYYQPDVVTTKSCALDYRIDTKGFYRPVYVFEILIDTESVSKVIIPAMK